MASTYDAVDGTRDVSMTGLEVDEGEAGFSSLDVLAVVKSTGEDVDSCMDDVMEAVAGREPNARELASLSRLVITMVTSESEADKNNLGGEDGTVREDSSVDEVAMVESTRCDVGSGEAVNVTKEAGIESLVVFQPIVPFCHCLRAGREACGSADTATRKNESAMSANARIAEDWANILINDVRC